MEIVHFVTYAVALSIAAVIPGPGIIALVARALGSGFRPTMPMLLGIIAGDVVYLGAAIVGLAWIATQFAVVFTVLKYAGAAYLFYMAWGFWRSGITAETIQARKAQGGWASFTAGLLVTLGNPKAIIFYMALLPNLFDLALIRPADFAILIVLTTIVLLVTLTPYVALAGRARQLLQTPKALLVMNRIAGTCLAGAATAIALRGS
ncbi:MAG: LysE family translocator [Ahrensia sp.]